MPLSHSHASHAEYNVFAHDSVSHKEQCFCSQHQTADCIFLHSRSCHDLLLMHPKVFPRFQSCLFKRIATSGPMLLYAVMRAKNYLFGEGLRVEQVCEFA